MSRRRQKWQPSQYTPKELVSFLLYQIPFEIVDKNPELNPDQLYNTSKMISEKIIEMLLEEEQDEDEEVNEVSQSSPTFQDIVREEPIHKSSASDDFSIKKKLSSLFSFKKKNRQSTTMSSAPMLLPPKEKKKKRFPDDKIFQKANLLQLIASVIDDFEIIHDEFPLNFCKASIIGLKPTQEDRIQIHPNCIAVLDGHGGEVCSSYLQMHLAYQVVGNINTEDVKQGIHDTFINVNEMYRESLKRELQNPMSGSTATVALFHNQNLYLAYTGDSPAILFSHSGTPKNLLTNPHSSANEAERKRIEDLGGMFTVHNDESGNLLYRVNGMITVTRAFGDFRIPCIQATPEIAIIENVHEYKYLVVASDGLTESMKDNDIWNFLEARQDRLKGSMEERDKVMEELVEEAVERGSCDNVSVVLVVLKFQ